jgi:hypothetical protein
MTIASSLWLKKLEHRVKPVWFRIFTFTLISKLIQLIFEKLEHRVKREIWANMPLFPHKIGYNE